MKLECNNNHCYYLYRRTFTDASIIKSILRRMVGWWIGNVLESSSCGRMDVPSQHFYETFEGNAKKFEARLCLAEIRNHHLLNTNLEHYPQTNLFCNMFCFGQCLLSQSFFKPSKLIFIWNERKKCIEAFQMIICWSHIQGQNNFNGRIHKKERKEQKMYWPNSKLISCYERPKRNKQFSVIIHDIWWSVQSSSL
jgi:hypothetical protein